MAISIVLFLKAKGRGLDAVVNDMFGVSPPLVAKEVPHKGYTDKKGRYHKPHTQTHKVKPETPRKTVEFKEPEAKPNEEDFESAQEYLNALQDWRERTGNRTAHEERKEARAERYEKRADRALAEASEARKRADDAVAGIPMGQPILIGHHSERRHRAALARSDRAMRQTIDAQGKAEHYAGRAASARANAAISSDDEDAGAKLKAKIEDLEAGQKMMKDANRVIRRKGASEDEKIAGLVALGISEAHAKELLKPDYVGRIGFADYQLKNNNANIRRYKQRLEDLERSAEARQVDAGPQKFDGGEVHYDTDDNRLRILFDAKPDADVRQNLKRNGFRWSPKAGAWQRQLTGNAKYAAERVLGITLEKASYALLVLRKSAPTGASAGDAQLRAGNYKKPKVRFQGLQISIENPAGSTRTGTGPGGKPWKTRMRNHYGYIRGSLGVDKDHVDCYLGPDKNAPMAYVVHQRKAGQWDRFDEDKVMLGFRSQKDAKRAYLAHYDDKRFLGPVTAMPMDEFKIKVLATRDKPRMLKASSARRGGALGQTPPHFLLRRGAGALRPGHNRSPSFLT